MTKTRAPAGRPPPSERPKNHLLAALPAMVGALGMLSGALLYVRAYPTLKPMLEAGDFGKVTFPQATRPLTVDIGAAPAVSKISRPSNALPAATTVP